MRLAAAALAALLVAGCATPSSWNPLRWVGIVDPPANQPTPLTEIRASVTPRAVWTTGVGKASGYRFRPDVTDGRIYTAAADGVVTVLEEGTGRVVARHDTKKKLSGGVRVAGDKVIVGTSKGEVLAIAPDGRIAWTTALAGEVIAPAAASRNTVVIRISDGRIFGLAMDDGKRRWVYQRPNPPLLLRTEAGVLAIGNDVVAGYPNGKLIALDLDDGKLTWEVSVSSPRGATELERIADVAGIPLLDGPRVCAAAFQGKVSCFEIQSRNVLWARDLSSSRSLAADAKNIYVVDDASNVHALDKAAGASVWKQDKLLHRRLSSPVVHDGRLVVGDGYGFLHVLSPEDGSLIGRLATDGSAILSLVPTPSGLLLQTEKGSVVMVRF
jgi:outer membrane protein assembly factor BamB